MHNIADYITTHFSPRAKREFLACRIPMILVRHDKIYIFYRSFFLHFCANLDERAVTTVEYIFLTTPQPPCTHNQSSVLHHLSLDFIITRSTAAEDLNAFCLKRKWKIHLNFSNTKLTTTKTVYGKILEAKPEPIRKKGVKKRSKKSRDLK